MENKVLIFVVSRIYFPLTRARSPGNMINQNYISTQFFLTSCSENDFVLLIVSHPVKQTRESASHYRGAAHAKVPGRGTARMPLSCLPEIEDPGRGKTTRAPLRGDWKIDNKRCQDFRFYRRRDLVVTYLPCAALVFKNRLLG